MDERRNGLERRSGLDRRAGEPAIEEATLPLQRVFPHARLTESDAENVIPLPHTSAV